ncbi:hypothetical protein TWF225_007309 [Orbilia oligospora]|uniref:histone acetyltransferase n=1 Tax=Orbilia oligospora TaxID=2813651 RepID=A0A7C8JZ03_ORBOL|nr:hypothetical protein TWF751_003582 [Orbilia oligospora]KAF3180451.1 hypothetical protein TWF225_007309 [Orbilia oligospora]KAF3238155.1 hypothetical protein TWF128_000665 [Orbilia oligospora]KAF3241787.1 hypothetical protein TWF217_011957 [Orbilia oligospora]KAF3295656.1 hypothetical protein TWF132_000986 [Orbilia oligospora]
MASIQASISAIAPVAESPQAAPSHQPSALASVLSGFLSSDFTIHHISHPPTRCDPLYSAPRGQKPLTTRLTRHFLAVSSVSTSIIVYAIEVHIYTTRSSTTIFVSKADSTGFLPKPANPVPKGSASPIRATTTAFLEYLITEYNRPGIPTHLTLFARAQDQYLFPNSINNKSKHVLSDIQLIRWWARVFDPLISSISNLGHLSEPPKSYLLVPGLEATDLRNVIPSKEWIHGHPYSHPSKPVRECIPQFEDDPKARFLNELEEEGWKGCRNMKDFWELMSFRQECSLGKSVGFLSLIFEYSKNSEGKEIDALNGSQSSQESKKSTKSPSPSVSKKRKSPNPDSKDNTSKKRKIKLPDDIRSASTYTIASILRNPTTREFILRRSSRLNSRASSFSSTDATSNDTGRKGKVMSQKDYDRLMHSLLDSDFQGSKCARESSELWIQMAGKEQLPDAIKKDSGSTPVNENEPKVNVLTVRKRKSEEELGNSTANILIPRKKSKGEDMPVHILQPRKKSESTSASDALTVNVLQPRRKTDEVANATPTVNILQPRKKVKEPEKEPEPVVNVLQPRKKPKAGENGGVSDRNNVTQNKPPS